MWNIIFLSALIYNLMILIFNKFFTDDTLERSYPEVFSKFGQIIIILFGFMFYESYRSGSKTIFLLYAIEKFMYFLSGVYYWSPYYKSKQIESIIHKLFMLVYWIGDLIYAIIFLSYALN